MGTTALTEDTAQDQLKKLINENAGTQRMTNVTFGNSNQAQHVYPPNAAVTPASVHVAVGHVSTAGSLLTTHVL